MFSAMNYIKAICACDLSYRGSKQFLKATAALATFGIPCTPNGLLQQFTCNDVLSMTIFNK